jgi:hypothetical protein
MVNKIAKNSYFEFYKNKKIYNKFLLKLLLQEFIYRKIKQIKFYE